MSATAPTTTLVDKTDDDGLEMVVHVVASGIVVQFYDAGRREAEDPYATAAMTWDDILKGFAL